MSEKLPSSVSEFYRYAIFIIYAVVLGQSFPQITLIFIPFTNLLSFVGFQKAFMLIFVYFFIISSWIGYFKSTSHRPHSENKFGLIRFGIDIIIIYEFYYLVNLIPKIENYNDVFIYVFPIIFLTFSIWDITKHFEFRTESRKEKVDRRNRFFVTLILLVSFVFTSILYLHVLTIQPLLYDGNNVWNIIFIIISFILIVAYRKKKWNIPKRRERKRKVS